jgi:hypothetical protein
LCPQRQTSCSARPPRPHLGVAAPRCFSVKAPGRPADASHLLGRSHQTQPASNARRADCVPAGTLWLRPPPLHPVARRLAARLPTQTHQQMPEEKPAGRGLSESFFDRQTPRGARPDNDLCDSGLRPGTTAALCAGCDIESFNSKARRASGNEEIRMRRRECLRRTQMNPIQSTYDIQVGKHLVTVFVDDFGPVAHIAAEAADPEADVPVGEFFRGFAPIYCKFITPAQPSWFGWREIASALSRPTLHRKDPTSQTTSAAVPHPGALRPESLSPIRVNNAKMTTNSAAYCPARHPPSRAARTTRSAGDN